jgi:hypothetical protein
MRVGRSFTVNVMRGQLLEQRDESREGQKSLWNCWNVNRLILMVRSSLRL